MSLIIHRVEKEDAKIVTQLLKSAFQEFKECYTPKAFAATVISPREVEGRMQNGMVWLAELYNQPVGTLAGYIRGSIFHIQGMAVSPNAQGKKVGYALLKTAEQFARSDQCSIMQLCTTPFLKKAIGLYENFGFYIIDQPPYDLFGTPLFNMAKTLPK